MPRACLPSSLRLCALLAMMATCAACTPGGQFDPSEMFNSDMFNTKKKIQGERQPLFPDGVPGTSSGVPKDLVKGYQPPPDQPADTGAPAAATAPPPAQAAAKPAPKPKPAVARAKTQPHDTAFDQKPASSPTRISVGPSSQPAAAASQSVWPTPPSAAPAQQSAQAPQSVWPAPPSPAPAQQNAQTPQPVWPAPPTQRTAQPSQSIWPNPPPTGTSTQ